MPTSYASQTSAALNKTANTQTDYMEERSGDHYCRWKQWVLRTL